MTNHYLGYIKGANDFEINELLIIADLLKVSYHASEDHNSNVNMNSFSFYVAIMSKICHKILKYQVHQHFPKYINTYSQDLEHN